MLVCGLLVIANRNPVASAMFLVLLFVFLAGLFLLLEALFIAVIQILVYAGAVMVLFLFVIMLLDIKASERRKFKVLGVVGGIAVAVAFVWELEIVLSQSVKRVVGDGPELHGSVEEVIKPFFAHYMLPFEVTALLLLVGMVGVVLLSKKDLK